MSLIRVELRLRYESCTENLQMSQIRKTMIKIQRLYHPSEVEQTTGMESIEMKMMKKPSPSMQVINLLYSTPLGFEMERALLRLNMMQSQMKWSTLKIPTIRFKVNFGRSRWFLGISYSAKCCLKHGLQKW